jgi:hypothetical protein
MMMTQTGRLVLATALLWIGFGVGGRAEAGGIALSTPAGLSPGESFRFVFVTDGTTTATSSTISTYDTFVNNQAEGATYNGSTISWLAIGSTSTVDAITHDGVNPSISGVYLVNGTQVATGDGTATGGLWSGTLSQAIDIDVGSTPNIFGYIWTGTTGNGTSAVGYTLGVTGNILTTLEGFNNFTNSEWVQYALLLTQSSPLQMYGISEVLTVQPSSAVLEPSSLLMAGTAIFAGSAFGWSRRRRDQQW